LVDREVIVLTWPDQADRNVPSVHPRVRDMEAIGGTPILGPKPVLDRDTER
jgi:tRNA (Thr-GGU) A37 N-methylase